MYLSIYDDPSLIKSNHHDAPDYHKRGKKKNWFKHEVYPVESTYYGSPIRDSVVLRPEHQYFPQSLMSYSREFEHQPPYMPYSRNYPPSGSSWYSYPPQPYMNSQWETIGYLEAKDGNLVLTLQAKPDVLQRQLDPYGKYFQYQAISNKGKVRVPIPSKNSRGDGLLKEGDVINNVPGYASKSPFTVHLSHDTVYLTL
jgi:hypothetical protein